MPGRASTRKLASTPRRLPETFPAVFDGAMGDGAMGVRELQ